MKIDYSKINQGNYDLMWKVGFPFLYVSTFLDSGYKTRDAIFYNDGNEHYTFLSKKEREKLSKFGLKLYSKGFGSFKSKLLRVLVEVPKKIALLQKTDLKKLSNKELGNKFLVVVKLSTALWRAYFYTEYHTTDAVSLAIQNNNKNAKVLKKNTAETSKLKYGIRTLINKVGLYSPNLFEKYLKEISKRLKIKNTNQYTYWELIDLLNGKKVKPSKRRHVMWGKFSGWKEIPPDKARKLFSQLMVVKSNILEFKGNIASKGYYKGRVKKIEFSFDTDFAKEISLMKKGDVLVSGSTGPEMILACKKAGAIITEEGGIMSHAALVSRELGIPSIIGTRIATKVLKDGDLVEVDANNGVVRVLKRA
ncbi:MAG: PEP-utilizing enzyme [Candidatus Doudnabacteria bacterium]